MQKRYEDVALTDEQWHALLKLSIELVENCAPPGIRVTINVFRAKALRMYL